MDKKRALRMLDSSKMPDDLPAWWEAMRESKEALRREVECELSENATLEDLEYLKGCIASEEDRISRKAEKPKRPSLGLRECEIGLGGIARGARKKFLERDAWVCEEAADTLRTLREEVVPALQRLLPAPVRYGALLLPNTIPAYATISLTTVRDILRKLGIDA